MIPDEVWAWLLIAVFGGGTAWLILALGWPKKKPPSNTEHRP